MKIKNISLTEFKSDKYRDSVGLNINYEVDIQNRGWKNNKEPIESKVVLYSLTKAKVVVEALPKIIQWIEEKDSTYIPPDYADMNLISRKDENVLTIDNFELLQSNLDMCKKVANMFSNNEKNINGYQIELSIPFQGENELMKEITDYYSGEFQIRFNILKDESKQLIIGFSVTIQSLLKLIKLKEIFTLKGYDCKIDIKK